MMSRIAVPRIPVRIIITAVVALAAMWLLLSPAVQACSNGVFTVNGKVIIGRNMDWPTGAGDVVINPGKVERQSLLVPPPGAAHWYARYGFLSFNLITQVAGVGTVSAPGGGINEKGLYTGSLWSPDPHLEKQVVEPGKKRISIGEVVPFILSQYATVDEALKGITKVGIEAAKTGDDAVYLHWLLVDAQGKTAYVQLLNGKLEIYRPPVPLVMTNESYGAERDFLKGYQGFGGAKVIPAAYDAKQIAVLDRFLLLTKLVQDTDSGKRPFTVDSVFDALWAVRQDFKEDKNLTYNGATQWSEVYDFSTRTVYWRARDGMKTKFLKLDDVRFDIGGTKAVVNIQAQDEGNMLGKFKLIF